MRRAGLLAAVIAAAGEPALGLDNPLEAGLLHCANETQQQARLACFDALVTTIPKVKADEFGLTADVARKRQPSVPHAAASAAESAPVESRPPPESDVLAGRIIALREAPRGEVIFTLDNKQVWMQTEAEPSKRFSLGDNVRIEHGVMGTYWLAADRARKTKVKRVS